MLRKITTTYAQAGLKACLLTFYQPGVECFYASADLETISTLGLSFQEGLSALVAGSEGSSFSETQTAGTNGELFLQQITLDHAGTTAQKRTLLHSLSQGRIHALVQDAAGRWWFYGQQRGLKLRYKSESGATLTLSFAGLEQEPARQVAASLVPGLLSFIQ